MNLKNYRTVSVLGVLVMLGNLASAQETLSPGHRLLIERWGLQVQALGGQVSGNLSLERWVESNFTAPVCVGSLGPGSTIAKGRPWACWVNSAGADFGTEAESRLVSIQFKDEQRLNDPNNFRDAVEALNQWRSRYPNSLRHTNQWGTQEFIETMRKYMKAAVPDMVSFDTYPFNGKGLAGDKLNRYYRDLQKYRLLGLGGIDGTADLPIPYGQWLQTYVRKGHVVSESEVRLNQFAAWAFGYKWAAAFIYNASDASPGLASALFDGKGDKKPTATFYHVAETNRQSLNLGPTLVRLLSTDIRFIQGAHKEKAQIVKNELPTGLSRWNAGADPYITNISATNLGSKNDGLKGDVIVGYFVPLLESLDGPKYEGEIYFMIVNGLSEANGLAAETRQNIRIEFDFGKFGHQKASTAKPRYRLG